jgi:SRSO17 transposase
VPEEARRPERKSQIALGLLDRARGEGLPGLVVVADSGCGASGPFRDGLAGQEPHYVIGVTDEMVVFTAEPRRTEPEAGTGGRRRKRPRLNADSPRPVTLMERDEQTPRHKVAWREGTNGPIWGRFAWLRVWPAGGRAAGECAGVDPLRPPTEEQPDGRI